MSMDKTVRQGTALIGVGAAACVGCCAGPLIGFVAAASLATAVGVALFGIAGLSIAVVAVLAYLRGRDVTRKNVAREPVPVVLGPKRDG